LLRKKVSSTVNALARAGDLAQDAEVPEEELEQQRPGADHLDVGGGERGDQPVARQPHDAEQEPQDGRQHDADARGQQGVEETD
jgi:hypothetical protein